MYLTTINNYSITIKVSCFILKKHTIEIHAITPHFIFLLEYRNIFKVKIRQRCTPNR